MTSSSEQNSGPLSRGLALVWRRQRILWWIFAVNLVFAFWAGRGVSSRLADVMDHSLASARLLHGFSLGAYQELNSLPSQPFSGGSNYEFGAAFFFFMLLATGGILETFRSDENPTTGAFFGACGRFFWRFLRMMVLLVLALIPAAIIGGIFYAWGTHTYTKDISDAPGLWIDLIGTVISLVIVGLTRLWFDMAEVITVVKNEAKSRRAVAAAWRLLWRNFGSLVWIYFSIAILCSVIFLGGLWLWMWYGPSEAVIATFIITELLTLFWLACRLWQRAAETSWYQRHIALAVAEPVPAPVPAYNPGAAAWPPPDVMPIPPPEVGPATEPEEM